MLKWVVAVAATVGFVWGLARVSVALSCSFGCTTEIILGVVGVTVASLSFVYLAYMIGQIQRSF